MQISFNPNKINGSRHISNMSSFEYRGGSDYRGGGEYRGRGGRSRGGPRGGFRGGRGGGYMDRDSGRGGFRGRGGFSRGRGGGGPPRNRDDFSPPRTSRSYEISDRGRGPPSDRRDRFDDSFDRAPILRYTSPLRDTGRGFDRHSSPSPVRRDRDFAPRHSDRDYTLSARYSPPPRDSGYGSSSYKDSYTSLRREERRPPRDYPPRASDYDRRDFRDSPKDYGSRDYPPPRNGDYRDSLGSRDFKTSPRGDRYGSGGRGGRGRFSYDDRPPRDYGGRGRGNRDDRGPSRGYMNGSRGSRGGPRGRGRDFSGGRDFISRDRRSLSREGAGGKRPRMDSGDYRR